MGFFNLGVSSVPLYASDTNNGWAIVTSTKTITSIDINAGYKASSLEVYASVDGVTWVLVETLTTATAYGDFTVDIDETAGYKYIKLDATGAQVRVKNISVTVVD